MCAQIRINVDSVKRTLTNLSNNDYPKFYDNLKISNNKFKEVNTYWSKKRYTETMTAWNDAVFAINGYLKAIVDSFQIESDILKNYTLADGTKISAFVTSQLRLDSVEIRENSNLLMNPEKLLDDLRIISDGITRARDAANLMGNTIKNADWEDEDGSIDRSKKDISRNFSKIASSLDKLDVEVQKSLNLIAEDQAKAKKSYGK